MIKTISTTFVAAVVIYASFTLGTFLYTYRLLNSDYSVPVIRHADMLEKAIENEITVFAEDRPISVRKEEVSSWVESYTRNYTGQQDLRLVSPRISDYITALATGINRDPINARFKFENNRASIFTPAIAGQRVKIDESRQAIRTAIFEGKAEAELVIEYTEPEITLEKVNSLGITALLSTGESNFVGSSAARVQNIRISSAKFNGLILEPGEELSFNTILGPVDETGGYAAEKVIKGKQLVYEYGGGICQVSTTVFRAAIFAGLPIKERKNHSFPVQYYNPQGFDATIYPGVQDLRFVNDTGRHLLIQSRIVGSKLFFEFYGSSDGRKVTIDGPHQYDIQTDGSMKAYFVRTIAYEGKDPTQQRFNSIYRSPALYPLARNPLE